MEGTFVGIDAGWKRHCLAVFDNDGNESVYREFETETDKLIELRDYLLGFEKRAESVHVAIEDPCQAVVDVLLDVGISVWSINPKKTAQMREMRWADKAKDDRRDAQVIGQELRIRPEIYVRVESLDPILARMRQVKRFRQDRVKARISEQNQLTELLRRFFPQYLTLGWQTDERVMLDLLSLVSHPKHLARVSHDEVKKALGRTTKHSVEKVLELLKNSPLPQDESLLDTVSEMIEMRVKSLRHYTEQLAELDRKLEQMLEEYDRKTGSEESPGVVTILRSFPGIGPMILVTLLSEGALAIERGDRELLRRKSIAPVTMRTGNQGRKTKGNRMQQAPVRRRYFGNRELQGIFYHLGRLAVQNSEHYKTRYKMMSERGHTHGRACRQIADQALVVLFAMLRERTLYDPAMHGATLCKNGRGNVHN